MPLVSPDSRATGARAASQRSQEPQEEVTCTCKHKSFWGPCPPLLVHYSRLWCLCEVKLLLQLHPKKAENFC